RESKITIPTLEDYSRNLQIFDNVKTAIIFFGFLNIILQNYCLKMWNCRNAYLDLEHVVGV
ncbi:MAG TPA: hypothetical protein VI146_07570, partial [Nitrososphaeraceae archaeon]